MNRKTKNMITHFINPLHLYCKLRDIGISKETSQTICKKIEQIIMTKTNAIATYRI